MSTKIDKTQIRNADGTVSEWLTLIDHPTVVALSASIDAHLTETSTISASESMGTGDMVVLNDNGTVAKAGKAPSTAAYIREHIYSGGAVSFASVVYSPDYDVFITNQLTSTIYQLTVVNLSGDVWTKGNSFEVGPRSDGSNDTILNAYDYNNNLMLSITGYLSGGLHENLQSVVSSASMSGDWTTVDIEFSSLQTKVSGVYNSPIADFVYTSLCHYNSVSGKFVFCYYAGSSRSITYIGCGTIITSGGAPSAYYFDYEHELAFTETTLIYYNEAYDQYIACGVTETHVISISGDSLVIDDTISNPLSFNIFLAGVDGAVADELDKFIFMPANPPTSVYTASLSAGTIAWDGYSSEFPYSVSRYAMDYSPTANKFVIVYDGGALTAITSFTLFTDPLDILYDDKEVLYSQDDPIFSFIVWNDEYDRMIVYPLSDAYLLYWYKLHGQNVTSHNFYGIYQGVDYTTDLFVPDIFLTDTVGWSAYVNNILETLPGENGISITYVDSSNGGLIYFREVLGTLGALTSDLIVGKEYIISGYVKVVTTGYVRCSFNNIDMVVDGNILISNAEWLPFDDYIFTATTATGHSLFVNSMGAGEVFYIKDLKISTAHKIGRTGYMDSNQSGLTINTNYYIDDIERLTTDSTKPYVGKAVSDTEIIIKG